MKKSNCGPKRICIICEGDEENDYIDTLNKCKVWSDVYIVNHRNAHSIDRIFNTFSYWYQQGIYDLILVFCDTEVYPYKQYNKLLKQINAFLNKRDYAQKIVYYGNPCTMQIILSHFDKVALKSNQKSVNAKKIEQLTNVKEYEGQEKQRKSIMNKINSSNYIDMKNNLKGISSDREIVPSTNFIELMEKLESVNTKWISDINKLIK